ncbi:hypothetical protein JM18_009875 [Phytophthora kernoviae]|uniref:RxLR effector protein n=1 Tax=Phytophthora kernoviae TaxID=325452 RepID=A0A921S8J5_9STRA|nr:hypothetical protein JM18_009875 [Phytophthora kernoviae]
MRVSYVLFTAALTLVAVGDAASVTTNSGMAKDSSGKRFLRSYGMTDLDKKDDASEEERGPTLKLADLKLLDDVVQPDKIKSALGDAAKQKVLDDLIHPEKIKSILNDPAKQKVIDDLIQPEKIQAALGDAAKRDDLFQSWFMDKEISAAIAYKLSANGQFSKNKDIVLAYSNYRTWETYGKVLGGWLHTKDLDSAKETMGKSFTDLKTIFGKWYGEKRSAEAMSKLVNAEPGLEKKS